MTIVFDRSKHRNKAKSPRTRDTSQRGFQSRSHKICLYTNIKWAPVASVKNLSFGAGGFEECSPHNETSATPPANPPPPPSRSHKRRNFTAEEDLALLRQALSERPYIKERGKTIAAWGALAAQLVRDNNFSRDKLSGKKAQARFDKLVLQKRQQNAVALAASGVEEEETEKDILLDELIALIDDHADVVTLIRKRHCLRRVA